MQALVMSQIADLPRLIHGPLVLAIRRVRRSSNRGFSNSRAIEQTVALDEKVASTASLTSILRHDKVVRALAANLHYSDVVNISLTSRAARGLITGAGPEPIRDRVSQLRTATCLTGAKYSCWACARTICEVRKEKKKTPRDVHVGFLIMFRSSNTSLISY